MEADITDGFAPTIDAGQVSDAASLPIFDVQRVQLRFDISADFVAAQVANNVLILALSSGRILRFDLDNAQDIDDIDLPKKPADIGLIRRLFLDPSASHLIISTTLGENYYLHTQSRQPKALSRLRGVHIECIAWNPSQPTASTREILLGASDGNIYETFIEPSTEFYRREEKFVKNVYKSLHGPPVGIWLDSIDGSSGVLSRVIVATLTRVLRLIGRSGRLGNDSSGSIYTKLFDTETPVLYDVVNPKYLPASQLVLAPDLSDGPSLRQPGLDQRAIAWLCDQGIYCGILPASAGRDAVQQPFTDAKLVPRSKIIGAAASSLPAEIGRSIIASVASTDFHVLALVGSRLVAINRLDETKVFDQNVLEPGQVALGLYSDQKKNTFWLFTRQDIFEIVVTDETRDVWKIMLANGNFDTAARFASNAAQRDAVAVASGDHLVSRGRFGDAATIYGSSTKPFEDVALTFIDKGEHDALRKYLLAKLASLKKNATMQRIMVASWLVELFMAKLNQLDDAIFAKTPADAGLLPATRQEFQDFIKRYKSDLDVKATYNLINSHGREEEMLFFATIIEDYSYVLSNWVERERWQEAMAILKKQTMPETFYRYSNVLMEHMPVEFVDVLMRQADLDATNLVPALLNYSRVAAVPVSQNQAIRYLNFCINHQHSTNASIHNTLISIYATHVSSDESSLLSYLQTQSAANEQNYDPEFALRVCINHQCIESCVHIYCTMSRFASAVDLALKHDRVELAATVADRPENDVTLRKKLWLKVARKVISQTKGIKAAMEFLKNCDDLLRIEDLIPFFPDFVVIDDFKQEICEALEAYSRQIDALRREMDESVDTAQHIKTDIKALELRYAIVEPGERCWLCRLPLLMKQFFVFPCQHSFHADCLGKMVVNTAGTGKGKRIRDLQAEIGSGVVTGKKKERIITEYDGLVAAACVLCSESAVKRIDEPFITDADNKLEWAV